MPLGQYKRPLVEAGCIHTPRLGPLQLAGSDWMHFNPVARWPRKQRAELYGSNDIAVGQPTLLQMTAAQLVYPLYTVQVYTCPTSQDL